METYPDKELLSLNAQVFALKTLLKIILAHPALIDLASQAIRLGIDDAMSATEVLDQAQLEEVQGVYAEFLGYVQARLPDHA